MAAAPLDAAAASGALAAPVPFVQLLSLYVLEIDRRDRLLAAGVASAGEDMCFVCKDGGELSCCDFQHGGAGGDCPKVYHERCTGTESLPDPWYCPWHLCSHCGDTSVEVSCRLCPSSWCSAHMPRDAGAAGGYICAPCRSSLRQYESLV